MVPLGPVPPYWKALSCITEGAGLGVDQAQVHQGVGVDAHWGRWRTGVITSSRVEVSETICASISGPLVKYDLDLRAEAFAQDGDPGSAFVRARGRAEREDLHGGRIAAAAVAGVGEGRGDRVGAGRLAGFVEAVLEEQRRQRVLAGRRARSPECGR